MDLLWFGGRSLRSDSRVGLVVVIAAGCVMQDLIRGPLRPFGATSGTDWSVDDYVGSITSLIASSSVARRVVREIIKQGRTLFHAVVHQISSSMFIPTKDALNERYDNNPLMEEVLREMMRSRRGEEKETDLEARIAALAASRLFNSREAMLRFEIGRASFPAFA